MATTIYEFLGHPASPNPLSLGPASKCPFINQQCTKTFNDGAVAGVCSLKPSTSPPVICCPNRLYADNHAVLSDVADQAFGTGFILVAGAKARALASKLGHPVIATFGKGWGGELRLPQRAGSGNYFVDWILARIEPSGALHSFVAVEVQSIDTTGSYKQAQQELRTTGQIVSATSGFNWENVNKRIIPQILYKGHVLQREARCSGGLFFVSPVPVFDKIMARLGGQSALLPYPIKASTVTFMSYDLDVANAQPGQPIPLSGPQVFTTDLQQLSLAFAGPGVMPPPNSYELAIMAAL
jgi:hypothetical protein